MMSAVALLLLALVFSAVTAAPAPLYDNSEELVIPQKRAALVLDRILIALQKALHEPPAESYEGPHAAPLRGLSYVDSNDMNSSSNVLDDQDYTFKHYYYPVSDGDDSLPSVQDGAVKRKINTSSDIDAFFDQPKTKKKKNISSTVGQGSKGGGISYISTNKDDSSNSAHLIKIEIFDMKKLAKVSDTSEHWKHADVRVKYYVKEKEKNKHLQLAKDLIYRITKEIAESDECKKYHFNL